jgi:hypothetical protein
MLSARYRRRNDSEKGSVEKRRVVQTAPRPAWLRSPLRLVVWGFLTAQPDSFNRWVTSRIQSDSSRSFRHSSAAADVNSFIGGNSGHSRFLEGEHELIHLELSHSPIRLTKFQIATAKKIKDTRESAIFQKKSQCPPHNRGLLSKRQLLLEVCLHDIGVIFTF